MGGLLFRKKKLDFSSELEDVDKKLVETDKKIKTSKQSLRSSLSWLLIIGAILECAYLAWWWVMGVSRPKNLEDEAMVIQWGTQLLPLLGWPILVLVMSQILRLFYRHKINSWENQLENLKQTQKEKLEELKATMNFKQNLTLMLQYSQKLQAYNNINDNWSIWSDIDYDLVLNQYSEILKKVEENQNKIRERERNQRMKILKEQQQTPTRLPQQPIRNENPPSSPSAPSLRAHNTPQQKPKVNVKEPEIKVQPQNLPPQYQNLPPQNLPPQNLPPQNLPPQNLYSPVAANKVGPTVISKVERLGDNTSNVKFFHKILDALLGGEEYKLLCGYCNNTHACVSKNEIQQEFVCTTCNAFNKKSNTNDSKSDKQNEKKPKIEIENIKKSLIEDDDENKSLNDEEEKQSPIEDEESLSEKEESNEEPDKEVIVEEPQKTNEQKKND